MAAPCIGNAGDLTPGTERGHRQERPGRGRGAVGQPQFRSAHPPEHPRQFPATSPPLVVAYAIAGNVTRDLMTEPVGKGKGGKDIWLGDIWPRLRGNPRADEVRDGRQEPSRATTNRSRNPASCGARSRAPRARSTTGPRRRLHRRAAVLPGLHPGAVRRHRQRARRAGARGLRRLP
ncbi:hypothetical protein ACTMU2_27885 [Cupriavidus basilensis]